MQLTPTYRSAKTKDIPALLEMAREFWGTLNTYDDEFDDDSVIGILLLCKQFDLLYVAVIDNEVIGFIAAASGPILANKRVLMATEMGWWVKPEHRKSGAGLGLIEILEKSCKAKNIKYLNLVYLEDSMPSIVRDIYTSKGYTLNENTYTKVIK